MKKPAKWLIYAMLAAAVSLLAGASIVSARSGSSTCSLDYEPTESDCEDTGSGDDTGSEEEDDDNDGDDDVITVTTPDGEDTGDTGGGGDDGDIDLVDPDEPSMAEGPIGFWILAAGMVGDEMLPLAEDDYVEVVISPSGFVYGSVECDVLKGSILHGEDSSVLFADIELLESTCETDDDTAEPVDPEPVDPEPVDPEVEDPEVDTYGLAQTLGAALEDVESFELTDEGIVFTGEGVELQFASGLTDPDPEPDPDNPTPPTTMPDSSTTTTMPDSSTTTTPDSSTTTTMPDSSTTTAPEPTTTSMPEPEPPAEGDAAIQQEILAITNARRAEAGCGALTLNAQLNVAADSHSEDMASRNYFDHDSPEGEGPSDRARAAGYPSGVGENIAAGYDTAEDVMAGWMKSAGHRANIERCSYTELGVGYANVEGSKFGSYWTQNFG